MLNRSSNKIPFKFSTKIPAIIPFNIIVKQTWQLPVDTPALRLMGGWKFGPLEHDGNWTVIRIDIANVVLQLSNGSKLYSRKGIYLYLDPHELRRYGELLMTKAYKEAND